MWHCPHCGAPQAETARCWVCRRSSTTCSTCRNFRTSLAADVGYCALDRHRRPLTGLELRGCWAERRATTVAAHAEVGALTPDRAPSRGFVPLEEVQSPTAPGPASEPPPGLVPAPTFLLGDPIEGWESKTSLFGDPER